jgi:hypothetical protein
MTAQIQPVPVCQICLHPIFGYQETQSCPDCKTPYHGECWKEMGGCATYGCARMVETKKSDNPVSWWGTTDKKCPMCAETIPMSALECPLCHSKFEEIRPMSQDEVLKIGDPDEYQAYRRRATWLLIISAGGITSPLALLFGGIWYLLNRRQIANAGPMVSATVLMSLAICVVWIVAVAGGYVAFSRFHSAGGGQ